MLESPCNEYAKRYMPHGVPRADERHFAAALVDAQKIVCNETYRMHLPQADLDSYTRNLHTLQYPDNASGLSLTTRLRRLGWLASNTPSRFLST